MTKEKVSFDKKQLDKMNHKSCSNLVKESIEEVLSGVDKKVIKPIVQAS